MDLENNMNEIRENNMNSNNMLSIVKNRKIYFGISIVLVLISVILLVAEGIKPSIEFTGGSLYEVKYIEEYPNLDEVRSLVDSLGYGSSVIQPVGEDSYSVKTKFLSEEERQALRDVMSDNGKYLTEEVRYTSIGPSIGKELKEKATLAFILVALGIILFIAYAFRKISIISDNKKEKNVSSFKYGLTAVICLVHDVVITSGVYVLFGKFMGAELDSLFVVAILTVLGVSVNDTIVVFDRIRDNLINNSEKRNTEPFSETIDNSIKQTLARSINTSVTVVAVLLALYFFGPVTTKIFALTMTVGMFVGTFSSIFLAAPFLLVWKRK